METNHYQCSRQKPAGGHLLDLQHLLESGKAAASARSVMINTPSSRARQHDVHNNILQSLLWYDASFSKSRFDLVHCFLSVSESFKVMAHTTALILAVMKMIRLSQHNICTYIDGRCVISWVFVPLSLSAWNKIEGFIRLELFIQHHKAIIVSPPLLSQRNCSCT